MDKKLWHFYHAYAQDGQEEIWLPIVLEHVNLLRSSNLASKLSKTHIGVVGSKHTSETISTVFDNAGMDHEICALSDFGWEQVTLNELYEFSLDNDGYVLYAHTKGAAHPAGVRDLHRKTMNDHLIEQWQKNIALLSNGFCATGVFFLGGSPEGVCKEPTPVESNPSIKRYRGFFAGNFWWGNLKFIKKMGYPSMENRIKAEAWMNMLYEKNEHGEYMVYDMLPDKLYEILDK